MDINVKHNRRSAHMCGVVRRGGRSLSVTHTNRHRKPRPSSQLGPRLLPRRAHRFLGVHTRRYEASTSVDLVNV